MLASYQDVPYHNCLHGADVLQAMHALLNLAPTFDDALDDDVTTDDDSTDARALALSGGRSFLRVSLLLD